MVKTFKQVFNFKYISLGIVVAFSVFAIAMWLPNLGFIKDLMFSSDYSFGSKFSIIFSMLGSFKTNLSLNSSIATFAMAALFGINIPMIVYYIKNKRSKFSGKSGAATAGGFLAGILGVGCAACGTFVLGPLLSLLGLSGLIAALPLHGVEFGYLSILLLIYSIYTVSYTHLTLLISKRIQEPEVCKIK